MAYKHCLPVRPSSSPAACVSTPTRIAVRVNVADTQSSVVTLAPSRKQQATSNSACALAAVRSVSCKTSIRGDLSRLRFVNRFQETHVTWARSSLNSRLLVASWLTRQKSTSVWYFDEIKTCDFVTPLLLMFTKEITTFIRRSVSCETSIRRDLYRDCDFWTGSRKRT